jgi:O-antigen ligase
MIEKRPWLGYGYQAFWRAGKSEAESIWQAVGWEPPHAHNGFLELLLIFGWLGTSIYMVGFFLTFLKSLTLIQLNKAPEAFFPVVYLTFVILINISEASILSGFGWSLYVALRLLPLSRSSQELTTKRKPADFHKLDNSYLSQEVGGNRTAID